MGYTSYIRTTVPFVRKNTWDIKRSVRTPVTLKYLGYTRGVQYSARSLLSRRFSLRPHHRTQTTAISTPGVLPATNGPGGRKNRTEKAHVTIMMSGALSEWRETHRQRAQRTTNDQRKSPHISPVANLSQGVYDGHRASTRRKCCKKSLNVKRVQRRHSRPQSWRRHFFRFSLLSTKNQVTSSKSGPPDR